MTEEFEPALTIPLAPVDSVELVSLIDNVTDLFMPDQGPAIRWDSQSARRAPRP